jgi:hypothetical protein
MLRKLEWESSKEGGEAAVLVCRPLTWVGQPVVPGSTTAKCAKCGQTVFVAPDPPKAHLPKHCGPCVKKELEADPEAMENAQVRAFVQLVATLEERALKQKEL